MPTRHEPIATPEHAAASLRRLVADKALELVEGASIEGLIPLMLAAQQSEAPLEERVDTLVDALLEQDEVEDFYLSDAAMARWLALDIHGAEAPTQLLQAWQQTGSLELAPGGSVEALTPLVAVAIYGGAHLDQRAKALREALADSEAVARFTRREPELLRDLLHAYPSEANASDWLHYLVVSGLLRMYRDARSSILAPAAEVLLFGQTSAEDRIEAFCEILARDSRVDDYRLDADALSWWLVP
jgi:hypothetical protein